MVRTSSRTSSLIRRIAALAALAAASGAGILLAPALVSAQPQMLEQRIAAAQDVARPAAPVIQKAEAAGPAAQPRKVRVIKLFDVPPEQQAQPSL